MSTCIQETIELLEGEVEAIEQRRGELLRVIDALRPLADPEPAPAARRSIKKKAATKRGRTDGRTEQGPRQTEPP